MKKYIFLFIILSAFITSAVFGSDQEIDSLENYLKTLNKRKEILTKFCDFFRFLGGFYYDQYLSKEKKEQEIAKQLYIWHTSAEVEYQLRYCRINSSCKWMKVARRFPIFCKYEDIKEKGDEFQQECSFVEDEIKALSSKNIFGKYCYLINKNGNNN